MSRVLTFQSGTRMQKMQSTPRLQQQWSKMRTQPHCIEIYLPFQYRYDDFNPSIRYITGSCLHTALVKHEKESDSLEAQVKTSRLSIWQDMPKNIHRCSNSASFRSSLTKLICVTLHVLLINALMLINTVGFFLLLFDMALHMIFH